MVVGDGIDNDCDGKIDEELCTTANNFNGNIDRKTSLLVSTTISFPAVHVLHFLMKKNM